MRTAIYWGWDFGIRVIVLGMVFAIAGAILGTVCTTGLISPAGEQCIEYGFGGWNWAILLSGIGLIVVGVVSIATGREPPEDDESLVE